MRNAPPVLVPVGRFVWGGRIALMLALLTALVWLVLAGMQAVSAGRMALLGLVCLLSAGLSCLAWQREQLLPGELAWDGEGWWYSTPGGASLAVRVTLNWDAGRAMLLSVQAREADGWHAQHLWLQARSLPLQWHALRCAVYGRDTL